MTTFVFMTYEQWITENPEATKQEEKCEDCNGTGEIDCPHCGQTMQCETCEGSGKIESSREEYEKQLAHDKKIAEAYSKMIGG